MKKVLGCVRKACDDFDMLQNGDRIAVGLSGGKDSMLLLYALSLYRRYMKLDYSLIGLTVDLGFGGFDTDMLTGYCTSLDVPHEIVRTDIGPVVFDVRKESNPCSLCARMRKGAFYACAKALGCNKAAYAHHADDLIETLFLSLLYESRIGTFAPVTYLSRQDITLLRPFVYLYEKDVIAAVRKYDIPVCKNPCPASGRTKREEIKQLVRALAQQNPQVKLNVMAAIRNTHNYHLWNAPKPK